MAISDAAFNRAVDWFSRFYSVSIELDHLRGRVRSAGYILRAPNGVPETVLPLARDVVRTQQAVLDIFTHRAPANFLVNRYVIASKALRTTADLTGLLRQLSAGLANGKVAIAVAQRELNVARRGALDLAGRVLTKRYGAPLGVFSIVLAGGFLAFQTLNRNNIMSPSSTV